MTPGVGLNKWRSIGSLNRELKTYVEYVRRGWNVTILTFDSGEIPDLPKGINAVRFPHRSLLFLLPWLYKKLGRWADVIKTNQSNMAFLYTRAARYWKKPVLLRCGYVHGEYLESNIGLTPGVRLYQYLESGAFKHAAHCQVPTVELLEWVKKRYNIPVERITRIPNFVDVDVFRPAVEVKKIKSIISVGSLTLLSGTIS